MNPGNAKFPTAPNGDVLEFDSVESWIFDLDNTLYSSDANMFDQIDKRMCLYIARFLAIDVQEAYKIQKSYFREHGTTLRGLMDCHDMDPAPYLEYVHDIDVSVVPPDARLAAALERLPGRKFVFTNASAAHAERVLERLGVRELIDSIFDIVAAGYIPKPDHGPYNTLVTEAGIEPTRTVMVEDVARNLVPAAAMGMTTVWVATDRPWASIEGSDATPDYIIDDLTDWLTEVVATG